MDDREDYDGEDYDQDIDVENRDLSISKTNKGGLSNISSIERLAGTGRNRNALNTEMLHYGGNSSLAGGSVMRKHHARARSTINRGSSLSGPQHSQAAAPFQSSGPRFAVRPKQCKY